MFLLGWFLTIFLKRICLCCHIKFRCFSPAWVVWEHLSSFKLFLQIVFIMFLQFLYLLWQIVSFLLNKYRLWLLDNDLLLLRLLIVKFTRVGQVIESFVLIFILMSIIALHLHLLSYDSIKILTVWIIFCFLLYKKYNEKNTFFFFLFFLLKFLLMISNFLLNKFDLCWEIFVTVQFRKCHWFVNKLRLVV